MSNAPRPLMALMAAMHLPPGAEVPDWVHVLPTGTGIQTFDNRGPYHVTDAAAVIAASMADPRGMLIDVNHATDIAGPKGGDAPAHGWIKALEARADGIWAQVDWNASGRALLADRAYRGLSPVIEHLPDGTILRIKRASLTNVPNLQHLNALNMESPVTVSLNARLVQLLGLAATATDDQIVAAIPAQTNTALQSTMTAIGTTLGVDGGNGTAVLAAVQALQSSQATVTTLTARIVGLETEQKKTAADAWMAALIAAKRGIPADKREGLVTLHMQDAAQAETVAKLYPDLGPAGSIDTKPAAGEVITALNAEQKAVADQLGLAHDKFLADLQADAKKEAH